MRGREGCSLNLGIDMRKGARRISPVKEIGENGNFWIELLPSETL